MNAPNRLSVIFWPVAGIVILGVMALALRTCSGDVEVPVPKTDLPAGRLIVKSDLTREEIEKWGGGDDAVILKSEDLIGHVVRKGLKKKQAVPKDAVTGKVPAARYARSVLVELRPEKVTAVDVKPGDLVAIRLAPTSDSERLAPKTVKGFLVDDAEGSSGVRVLRLALLPRDLRPLLGLVGRALVLLTRA